MVDRQDKLYGYVSEKSCVFYGDSLPNPDGLTPIVTLSDYAALEAQLAERVKVKPLEWKPLSNTGSESGFGGGRSEYTLIPTQNGWRVYGIPGESDGGTEFFTMETAKAAAQADFDRRILSALAYHPRDTSSIVSHETGKVRGKQATPPAPKVTECATEGCEQTATVRFERGGVGSDYCHDCYMRIQALTTAQEAGKP